MMRNIQYSLQKKKSGNSYFIFSKKDDTSAVNASQITKLLPDPMMDHRGHYFPI